MNDNLGRLPDPLFIGVMAIVGVGWIALILYPRRHWAHYWVAGVVVPGILGVLYAVLMAVYWFYPPQGNVRNFFSLRGAYAMFANSGLLLAAWTDIVLLSLIAGGWIARKSTQLGFSSTVLLPLLVVTLAFPGAGLVLFYAVSAVFGKLRTLGDLERAAPIPSHAG